MAHEGLYLTPEALLVVDNCVAQGYKSIPKEICAQLATKSLALTESTVLQSKSLDDLIEVIKNGPLVGLTEPVFATLTQGPQLSRGNDRGDWRIKGQKEEPPRHAIESLSFGRPFPFQPIPTPTPSRNVAGAAGAKSYHQLEKDRLVLTSRIWVEVVSVVDYSVSSNSLQYPIDVSNVKSIGIKVTDGYSELYLAERSVAFDLRHILPELFPGVKLLLHPGSVIFMNSALFLVQEGESEHEPLIEIISTNIRLKAARKAEAEVLKYRTTTKLEESSTARSAPKFQDYVPGGPVYTWSLDAVLGGKPNDDPNPAKSMPQKRAEQGPPTAPKEERGDQSTIVNVALQEVVSQQSAHEQRGVEFIFQSEIGLDTPGNDRTMPTEPHETKLTVSAPKSEEEQIEKAALEEDSISAGPPATAAASSFKQESKQQSLVNTIIHTDFSLLVRGQQGWTGRFAVIVADLQLYPPSKVIPKYHIQFTLSENALVAQSTTQALNQGTDSTGTSRGYPGDRGGSGRAGGKSPAHLSVTTASQVATTTVGAGAATLGSRTTAGLRLVCVATDRLFEHYFGKQEVVAELVRRGGQSMEQVRIRLQQLREVFLSRNCQADLQIGASTEGSGANIVLLGIADSLSLDELHAAQRAFAEKTGTVIVGAKPNRRANPRHQTDALSRGQGVRGLMNSTDAQQVVERIRDLVKTTEDHPEQRPRSTRKERKSQDY